jgi:hypothetical protein
VKLTSQLQKDKAACFCLDEESKVVKLLETESRMVVSRTREEGKWNLSMLIESVLQDEKGLELCCK